MKVEKIARVVVTVPEEGWKQNLEEARDYMESAQYRRFPPSYRAQTPEEQAKRFLEQDVKQALATGSRQQYSGAPRWFKLSFEEWEG